MARLAATEVQVERLDAGVAADDGRVELQRKGAVAPVLLAGVGDLSAVPGVEIVGADGELRFFVTPGSEVFDHADAGILARDHERVGKHRRAVAERVGEDADGLLHLDALREVDEGAVGEEGLMQCGELGGAEARRLGEQVLADEVAVTDEGVAQRVDDHAPSFQLWVEDLAGNQGAVGEGEPGGLPDAHGNGRSLLPRG